MVGRINHFVIVAIKFTRTITEESRKDFATTNEKETETETERQ